MKICILTIATNKYIQFVEKLYDNGATILASGTKIEKLEEQSNLLQTESAIMMG